MSSEHLLHLYRTWCCILKVPWEWQRQLAWPRLLTICLWMEQGFEEVVFQKMQP